MVEIEAIMIITKGKITVTNWMMFDEGLMDFIDSTELIVPMSQVRKKISDLIDDDFDEIENYFYNKKYPKESEKETEFLTIRVSTNFKKRLEELASKHKRSMSNYVKLIIEEQLNNHNLL